MFQRKPKEGAKFKEDERDFFYEYVLAGNPEKSIDELPDNFSVPYDKYWIMNQGRTAMCVFFSALGIAMKNYNEKLSPRYLSKFGKKLSNLKWGAYTRDGVKSIVKFGSCLFKTCEHTDKDIKSDSEFLNFNVTSPMQQEANKFMGHGYVRADGYSYNKWDMIRLFIYNTKEPVTISTKYSGVTNIDDEYFYKVNNNGTGHQVLCIGWDDNKGYKIIDSVVGRECWLPRNNLIKDAWGITDFKSLEVVKPKNPPKRNIKLEQKNAQMLRDIIYDSFSDKDTARYTAGKNWFRLINAKTYQNYTYRDLMNWIYYLDRKGEELFDLSIDRSKTLK